MKSKIEKWKLHSEFNIKIIIKQTSVKINKLKPLEKLNHKTEYYIFPNDKILITFVQFSTHIIIQERKTLV